MNHRRRSAVLILGGVAATIAVATSMYWTREPVYQAHPLSYWVEQVGRPADSQAAWVALHEIGPSAIPFLFARIRHEHSFLLRSYRAAYPRLPAAIRGRLPAPTPNPVGLDSRTLHVIHAIGPSAVPQLLPYLSDKDTEIRWLAAIGIGMVGYGMDAPVVTLMPLTKDPSQKVRTASLQALGRMGSSKKRAIPAVLNALENDPFPQVRSAAAWALLGIGRDEDGLVVRAQKRALADPDPSTRQWAATGLWWETGDPSLIPFLIAELGVAKDEETWRRILPVLGQAGELAKEAVPIISAKLVELENLGAPLGEEDGISVTQEVLCLIDAEAAERLNSSPK